MSCPEVVDVPCLPGKQEIHKTLWPCALIQPAQERHTGNAELAICS